MGLILFMVVSFNIYLIGLLIYHVKYIRPPVRTSSESTSTKLRRQGLYHEMSPRIFRPDGEGQEGVDNGDENVWAKAKELSTNGTCEENYNNGDSTV